MRRHFLKAIIASAFLVGGCAGMGGGLNSISKTNQLSPSMPPAEVKAILGDPSQTQFIGDKWVWKYSLHEAWKGFVPYYLVFSRNSPALEQWFANESEYARQQQLWLQSFPPPQKHEVDIHIKK